MDYVNEKFDITIPLDHEPKKALTRAMELYCMTHGYALNRFRDPADPCELITRMLDKTMALAVVFASDVPERTQDGWTRLPKTVRHSIPDVAARIVRHFEKTLGPGHMPCTERTVRIKQLDGADPEYYHDQVDDPMDYDLIVKHWPLETNGGT